MWSGRRGRLRAHAEPRAHHRAPQAIARPALAATLGGRRIACLGSGGRYPRNGAVLAGPDAAARGVPSHRRPQDRAARRHAGVVAATIAGDLGRRSGPTSDLRFAPDRQTRHRLGPNRQLGTQGLAGRPLCRRVPQPGRHVSPRCGRRRARRTRAGRTGDGRAPARRPARGVRPRRRHHAARSSFPAPPGRLVHRQRFRA